jgi:glycine cleavage system H protein
MSVYFGCQIPSDLHFDVDRDVWVRMERDGLMTLGMTDVAQTRCGKLVNLMIKKPGTVVKQGRAAATVESAKWVGPFPMPFDGEVVEVNTGFEQDILLLNKDPYGSGWLVMVRPVGPDEQRSHLLTGEAATAAYQKRINDLQISCMRCAEDGTMVAVE